MKADLDPETEPEAAEDGELPRCEYCDEDCWDVPDKLYCWLGSSTVIYGEVFQCEIPLGFCPWLMPGIPYPPKL